MKLMENRSCVRDEIRRNLLCIKVLDVRDRPLEQWIPNSVLTKLPKDQLSKIVSYAELDEKVGKEGCCQRLFHFMDDNNKKP